MYAICLVFLMIWTAYAWTCIPSTSTDTTAVILKMDSPVFRQDCSAKQVPCIDDCSFLCTESNVTCVGGTCQTQLNQIPPCNFKRGGVLMMIPDPVPHWSCICTESRFFGGGDCGTVHPDVCEQGTFLYRNRKHYLCICPPPYELVTIDSKPHCLEKKMTKFFEK